MLTRTRCGNGVVQKPVIPRTTRVLPGSVGEGEKNGKTD